MLTNADELAAAILSKSIRRQAAIDRFAALTQPDRERVIIKLKSGLSGSGADDQQLHASLEPVALLQAVDERTLTGQHQTFLRELMRRYADLVPRSRAIAASQHGHLVDARKVTNLKKSIKALQFHITWERAEGPYLYDIDGNQYIDITGDFGVNIFGSQPEFVSDAIRERLQKGSPLLGYTEEVFTAANLFCELTGHERVAFAQSGTEAVVLAVRIARAATRKSKIVIFEGSFHGLSDTVGAVKDFTGNSLSAGLGIPQEYADQLIVLDYGNMDHLEVIAQRAAEIAGVLVEPVQSGQPHLQPVQFLKELRNLTLARDIPLIFDEMITGFRACPRGAQGYFGVKADIATYGKIPGGGLPTGMVAGAARYLDFVDGGQWQLEDDSMPRLKRVYIGGTHTRNPLKVAASLATLKEIRRRCPGKLECGSCSCFQKELNARTESMVRRLNIQLQERRLPLVADSFSSMFKFRFLENPFGLTRELFLLLLRLNGVEPSFAGNFFLTTAHTDEHVDRIIGAVIKSLDTLLEASFFVASPPIAEPARALTVAQEQRSADSAPVPVPVRATQELARLKLSLKTELATVLKDGI
jgi:glutamate-1-semialdehyde 2,1-aminomutase